MTTRHLWIPDTQVRADVPTKHIKALGHYIEEKRFEKIIIAGDWWDFPSTGRFNTALEQEGLRIQDDIESGNKAMDLLWQATNKRNRRVAGWKKKQYQPEKHFIFGNHEYHLERFVENTPVLSGMLGYEMLRLEKHGLIQHPFLTTFDLDGILYSHYFCNPSTGKSYSGMLETRLKNIGQSFTQGHLQEFMYGERQLPSGKRHHGCVAGAFYMHDEKYKTPQGNKHWRGVVVKNDVKNGEYDIMKISLGYLLRKYL